MQTAAGARGENFGHNMGRGNFIAHILFFIFSFLNTAEDLLEIQCIVFQSFPVFCTLASLTQNGQLMGGQRERGHMI